MVRVWLAVLIGMLGLLGGSGLVTAGETWCDTDPPVLITTPAGNQVVVYVVDGGPAEHIAELTYPTISYTVRAVENGTATKVNLSVTISDSDGHRHPVTSKVWTGPGGTGTLLSSLTGYAGDALVHQFKLNVP